MAAATAGLVMGAILGGPITEYLIKRHKLSGPAGAAAEEEKPAKKPTRDLTLAHQHAVRGARLPRRRQVPGAHRRGHRFHHAGLRVLPAARRGDPQRAAAGKAAQAQRSHRGRRRRSRAFALPRHGAHDDEAPRPRESRRPAARDPRAAGAAHDRLQRVHHLQRHGAQLRRRRDQRRAGRLRPFVHGVRARDHEGRHRPPRRLRRRVPHRADGRRILHRHPERDGHPGLARAPLFGFGR